MIASKRLTFYSFVVLSAFIRFAPPRRCATSCSNFSSLVICICSRLPWEEKSAESSILQLSHTSKLTTGCIFLPGCIFTRRSGLLFGKPPHIGIVKVSTLLSTENVYPLLSLCSLKIRSSKFCMRIVASISVRSPSDRPPSRSETVCLDLRKVESV